MPITTIKVTAKCADLCDIRALDEKGQEVSSYDGYVPYWLPNPQVQNDGDYIQLTIDVNTGKILNWKKPTQAQLKGMRK